MRLLLVVVALIAAACSAGDDTPSGAESPSDNTETSATRPPVPSEDPPTDGDEGPKLDRRGTTFEGLTFSVADGWRATSLGEGVKPVLALDPEGTPYLRPS